MKKESILDDWVVNKLTVKKLFNNRWLICDESTIKFFSKNPGVYIIAWTKKNLKGEKVRIQDIFYVGMTNSKGGIKQRLGGYFIKGVNNTKHGLHCAANRWLDEYSNKKNIKNRRFYFTYLALNNCNVDKSTREYKDLLKMGDITKFEYEVLAYIKKKIKKEPELNRH